MIKDYQRYARYMGIIYGIIVGHEMINEPLDYQTLERLMQQHCTKKEFDQTCNELIRYAHLVEKMKTER